MSCQIVRLKAGLEAPVLTLYLGVGINLMAFLAAVCAMITSCWVRRVRAIIYSLSANIYLIFITILRILSISTCDFTFEIGPSN